MFLFWSTYKSKFKAYTGLMNSLLNVISKQVLFIYSMWRELRVSLINNTSLLVEWIFLKIMFFEWCFYFILFFFFNWTKTLLSNIPVIEMDRNVFQKTWSLDLLTLQIGRHYRSHLFWNDIKFHVNNHTTCTCVKCLFQ